MVSSSAPEEVKISGRLQRFLFFIAYLSAGLGFAVLVGWHAHIAALIQIRPTLAPMQYNGAICFVLAGAAFWTFASGRIRVAQGIGAAIAVFSFLTLLEYVSGLELGIDQALFHPYISTESSPGRVSPATAVCFLQLGLAFILCGVPLAAEWRRVCIGSLGSVILSISFVALLGYAFGLPGTYGWRQLTRIAAHTALGLGFLGVGTSSIAWSSSRNKGERTPRWLPIPLGLATMTATFILSQALATKQNQEIAQTIQAHAEEVRTVLSVRMEARILSLLRMAKRWNFGGRPSQAAWEDDAKNYVADFPDFQAIEWIDPANLVRWIVPLKGNESKINANITRDGLRHRAVAEALRTRGPAITRTLELLLGGNGFIVYLPVYDRGASNGVVASVLKTQLLFQKLLPPAIAAGTSITVFEDGKAIYKRDPGPAPTTKGWVVDTNVDVRGIHWVARVAPTPRMVALLKSKLPLFVFIAGVVASAMLSLTAHLAQSNSTRARESAAINMDLRAALAEVKTLSGLLPICYDCKRIRDDGGYWNRLEKYITRHSNAKFSHGLCPECAVKAFEEAGIEVPESVHEAVEHQRLA